MKSSLLWNVVQRILVGSYRSFGTTSRSLLQGSSCPVHVIFLDNLMMGLIGSSETSVTTSMHCLTSQKSEDLTFKATPFVSVFQRMLLVCDFSVIRLVQPSVIIFLYISISRIKQLRLDLLPVLDLNILYKFYSLHLIYSHIINQIFHLESPGFKASFDRCYVVSITVK
jgi:hypothetical protein